MAFQFRLSDELKVKLRKLSKRDRFRTEIINKKIKEIIADDSETIERYKNLKYGLSQFKRIHIDKSFVLIFRVDKKNNLIVFEDFGHHDDIYR